MIPEDLLDGRFGLVTPPDLYLEIDALVNSPHASSADIGRIIERDPALTARLLRIANGPLYGLTTPVETIGRAIAVIGTWELHSLVLSSTIVSACSRIAVSRFDLRSFWRHSVLTASIARQLAQTIRHPHKERLFVAGLLHDIGLLILGQRFPELAGDWMREGGADHGEALARLEAETLGFDHGLLARTMLGQWNLGERILEPVACHHDASRATDDPVAAAIVQIADLAGAGRAASIPERLWRQSGLDLARLENVLDAVGKQHETINDALIS